MVPINPINKKASGPMRGSLVLWGITCQGYCKHTFQLSTPASVNKRKLLTKIRSAKGYKDWTMDDNGKLWCDRCRMQRGYNKRYYNAKEETQLNKAQQREKITKKILKLQIQKQNLDKKIQELQRQRDEIQ